MSPPASSHEESPPAASARPRPRLWPAVAAILVAAAALRIRGGWNDLWLDEIWSLEIAREVRSPLDVFVSLHHEINHHLNTLWLFAAGSHGNWIGYRVPSLVAGVASVAAAGAIARRRGPAALVFTLLVVSCSYTLVLYSSEVRGYAALVLFSYLSFLLLGEFLRRDEAWLGAAFAASATLGLVSHLLFTSVLLSSVVWSASHLFRRRLPPGGIAGRLALCHGVPLLCLAALGVHQVIVVGGKGTGSLLTDYGTALAWALGAPASSAAQLVGCILAVLVLDLGIRLVRRTDPGEALFFFCTILVFPVALVIARDSAAIYTRHFLLPVAFLLLLLGFVLGALWDRGRAARWAAVGLLLAYGAANGAHLRSLFALGRGQNGEAVRFVLEQSPPGPVTVGADDDHRIQRVVEFYAQQMEGGGRIEFVPRADWRDAGPAWLIVNRDAYELPVSRGDELRDAAGRRFELVRAFPAAPLAGLHWFVYRNLAR